MSTLKALIESKCLMDEALDEAYGEIPPDIEAQLMELEIQLPQKVDNIAFFIDKIAMECVHFENKADAYKKKSAVRKALKDRLNEYIKAQMIQHGMAELRGENETFKIQRGKSAVEIHPGSEIPKHFIKTIISEQPDRESLRKALENGEVFTGVELKPTLILKRKVL